MGVGFGFSLGMSYRGAVSAGGPALPEVIGNGSYTLDIVVDPVGGAFTLSGTENDVPWGPYPVTPEELAADEHNLRAIVISGTGTVGQTLTATTGLWIADPALSLSVSHQWERGGVPISGATGLTYTLVSADGGQNITCRETVGTTTVTSNAISVAAGFTNPTDLGSKLKVWLDFTDTAALFQDTAGTTPATANGNPVRRINNKASGGGYFGAASGNATVVTADTSVELDWVDRLMPNSALETLSATSRVYVVFNLNGLEGFIAVSDNTSFRYAGYALDGNSSAPDNAAGTPSYYFNGALVNPATTRNELYDAMAGTGYRWLRCDSVDLSGSESTIIALGDNGATTDIRVRHWIVTDGTETTGELAAMAAWLTAEAA